MGGGFFSLKYVISVSLKKRKKNCSLSLSLSLSTEMMKPLNQRNPPQEPPNNPQPDEVEGKDMFYMIYYWIS